MNIIRPAHEGDLDFIVRTVISIEGVTSHEENLRTLSYKEIEDFYKERMKPFVSGKSCNKEFRDSEKHAWIYDNKEGRPSGLIMFIFRDINSKKFKHSAFLDKIDNSHIPKDGRFCKIFELWVSPEYRRQGIATLLKKALHKECRRKRISKIFTYTNRDNSHVVDLNLKLGYKIINSDEDKVTLLKRVY